MKPEPPVWTDQCRALLCGPAWSERPFLIDGLSHLNLHTLAARLYWHLRTSAVDEPIILASENKALCAAALLSALAGGPPLLLPYALSPQALAALHAVSGCSHVLSNEALTLPQGLHRIGLPLDDPSPAPRPLPQTPAEGVVLSLFTGGSTGSPQLWSKTAANLFGEALFIAAHHGIQAQDRIAATIAPYHIYGLLYSVLLPLVSGAAVLGQTPAFPEEIVSCLRENNISILISVPAHYHALAGRSCAPCSLRLAFSSAGMLNAEDNRAFFQANQTGIVEVYGSTETGGIACRNRFLAEEHFTILPSIDWQLSPDERLLVRSPFLSPELSLDAAGFFHTADRVMALDDARFSLLGRADMVVKVAGKRVDLEMIRRLVQEQPGVREALVLALPEDGSRENRIVAILTTTGPDQLNIHALRQDLSRYLEPYALPRILKEVDQIPVKANGKYDREAILALVVAPMRQMRIACAAGYERMAARAELLDRINVFPVADADTGVNLRLTLAPLRDPDSADSLCGKLLQRGASGNSGNIAAAFFAPFFTQQPLNECPDALQILPPLLAEGNRLARQAVLSPQEGTMLDIFAALACFHDSGRQLPAGRVLLDQLACTVSTTARILPALRQAGVVDAGALGLFFFFEGFFAELLNDSGLCRPVQELFQGLLEPAPTSQSQHDQGSCITLSLEHADHMECRATIADPAFLATLGDSVVARQDGKTLRLHLHSQNPEKVREKIARLSPICQWHSELIEPAKPDKRPPGLLHLLCDAAGSLPPSLARQEGITLLDSYVICAGEAKPESLWQPAHIYQALREGTQVSTAQASTCERHEYFTGSLELYGPTLYLCVGSAYTGNHAAALAWQKQHDKADLFTVVDSGAASGRLASIALLASRASRRLHSKEALFAYVNQLCRSCEEYVFIDTLRYLVAGGRISKLSGLTGGLLGLKPVISPQTEGVRKVGIVRSQAAQVHFALTRIRRLKRQGRVALALLQFSDNEDWVRETVLPPLQDLLPASEILVVPLSLTSGVHMGPGTWALAACPHIGDT